MAKPQKPKPQPPEETALAAKKGRPDSLEKYREKLGPNVQCSSKMPGIMRDCIKEPRVRELIAIMALDSEFKIKVLDFGFRKA